VIDVYEKQTAGLIRYLNSYIEIDKKGYVIRIEGIYEKIRLYLMAKSNSGSSWKKNYNNR